LWFAGSGSCSKTSSPAPAISPASNRRGEIVEPRRQAAPDIDEEGVFFIS
jgi:hypothetical protein